MFFLLSHFVYANSDVDKLETRLAKIFPDHSQQKVSLCIEPKVKKDCLIFRMRQEHSSKMGKQRIWIEAPQKWNGVQILHIDLPQQEDPFWLYLPALKKVKKMSGTRTPLGLDISKLEVHLTGEETLHWVDEQHCSIQRYSKEQDNVEIEQLDLFFQGEQLIKMTSSFGYESIFSDYKNIGGYLIPHVISIQEEQKQQFYITLQEFQIRDNTQEKEQEENVFDLVHFQNLGKK